MATKAQVAQLYKDASIMQPVIKLEGDELQARLGQRSVKFQDKRTKRNRSRSAQNANGIKNGW